MKKLTVEVLASPKALAEWCGRQGVIAWGGRGCCPFPATDCPLGKHVSPECRNVTPEHWERVLKEVADGEDNAHD